MKKRDRIVIAAGEFDPLTYQDFKFLQKCRMLGDWLIVGVYSDVATHMNTGKLNEECENRRTIIDNLKCVDETFRFNDADGTDCNLIKLIKLCYPNSEIIYVSHEDMFSKPETKIRGITFEVISKE